MFGFRRSLVLIGLLFTYPAFAQDKACLLEGSFTMLGQTIEIKDCMQNNGVPQEQFVEICTGISSATTAMGGPPATITWLGSCPASPQGVCEGLFGAPVSAYYYKREVESLDDVKQGCVDQGGSWRAS